MKAYSGFESKVSTGKAGSLPVGAYVAKILAAKVFGDEPDQTLVLRMDIAEGPHKNYFTERYNNEVNRAAGKYEPKYKGDFRLRIPNDENTKALYPDSDKKRFNDFVGRIEASNPGYHWDWKEEGLKGLLIGVSTQQDEYNGVPFTRLARLEIVDDVRAGVVQPMQPRQRQQQAPQPIDQQTGFAQVEQELPW